jgi:hypothetical protein
MEGEQLMEKISYKNTGIGPCSEYSEIKKAWLPLAVVSYFVEGSRIDRQILSKDNLAFLTFEGANTHALELAKRWVDKIF